MANLPPSPFSSVDTGVSAETLVVASVSQAPAAAASSHPFDSGAALACGPDEAAAPDPQMPSAGAAADLSCIGEIFFGARKLEQIPGTFDQAAYTPADELLYVTLKAMDDPYAADLIDIPEGMWMEFDPAPLFIQQAMRA